MASVYSRVSHNLGFAPLRGKSAEFEAISEELYFADSRIKFLCLFDPSSEYNSAVAEREAILKKLAAVSKPNPKFGQALMNSDIVQFAHKT